MELSFKFFIFCLAILFIVSPVQATSIGAEVEKLLQCSKYDFEEKVLDKVLRMNLKVETFDTLMKKCEAEFKTGLENIEMKMELFLQERINNSFHALEDDLAVQMQNQWKDFQVKQKALETDLSIIKNRQPVAFSASLTKSIIVPSGNAIKFDKVWTNIQNGYDSSTGVFTAPVDGLYFFTSTLVSGNGKSLRGVIYKNGNSQSVVSYSFSTHETGNFHTVLTLNKGDRVDIRKSPRNGDEVYSESTHHFSMFTGFKI